MEPEDRISIAFKTINLIYMALGMGMILSLGVFYFLVENKTEVPNAELVPVFSFAVPLMGIAGFLGGRYLYKQGSVKSKNETDLQKKLALYQTHMLIVWALLEGPALFASIVYLLTGDALFLVFFAMIFSGFVFSKPSIAKFQQDF